MALHAIYWYLHCSLDDGAADAASLRYCAGVVGCVAHAAGLRSHGGVVGGVALFRKSKPILIESTQI